MTAQNIIDIAKYSEVGNLAVKNDINALIAFLNLGMTELYTRFPIKTNDFEIEYSDEVEQYDLPEDFMYAVCANRYESLDTLKDPIPVLLNSKVDPYSLQFVDWNSVQAPAATDDFQSTGIILTYAITPVPVTNTASSLTAELELPNGLVDALASYIGYRAHLGVRGDGQAENNAHWQRFERNCEKAQERGVALPIASIEMTNRLFDRGFV